LPAGVTIVGINTITSGGSVSSTTGVATGTNITVDVAKSDGTLGTTALTYTLLTGSSGAATVTYEIAVVAAAGPTTIDTISFPFYISAPSGTIIPVGNIGTVQASVGLVSSTTGFSTSATQLRFAANANIPTVGANIGTSVPCLTNLLFTFVSNRTGTTFNTGMAIANTANDSSFGGKNATLGDTGGVTLFFFGVGAPTGGTAGISLPIPSVSTAPGVGTVLTSGVIAPGEHTAFVLNDGSTKAIAPGFQGYVVALCNFRYAHGLGTIFDNFGVGPANVGFSYLGLVLSGTGSVGRFGANNTGVGTAAGTLGEVLGH
jgi:hypothetical protein